MLLHGEASRCAYCGATSDLQDEHIIPISRGGPDSMDNIVRACRKCNQQKGGKTPSEFYEGRWGEMPRIVQGKYLKLLYLEHERRGTLYNTEYPPGEVPKISKLAMIFSLAT